jgi:RimJ/RimL family protein N-acetyltransferase
MPWTTDDLRLRLCIGADASILVQLNADPDVQRIVGKLFPSIDEARHAISMRPDVLSSFYIVERLADDAAVGCAAFIKNERICDIDILIALFPQFRRKNYGLQVLNRMRKAWINNLNNDHCTATVLPNNDAARAVLSKCGFRQASEYINKSGEKSLIYRYP